MLNAAASCEPVSRWPHAPAPEQGDDERFAPVPAIYTQDSLRALIKKGDQRTRAESEVLNTYFDSGDAHLEEVIRQQEEEDADTLESDDDSDADVEETISRVAASTMIPRSGGTFSAHATAQRARTMQHRLEGDNTSLDWEPEVEA